MFTIGGKADKDIEGGGGQIDHLKLADHNELLTPTLLYGSKPWLKQMKDDSRLNGVGIYVV